jgi:hypothetical protein
MENPSYHRKQPVVVTDRMRRQIAGAVAEIDMAQMAILRRMTPAERMAQAGAMIEEMERAGAYRLRQRRPELSEANALRIVRGGLLEFERRQKQWKADHPAS